MSLGSIPPVLHNVQWLPDFRSSPFSPSIINRDSGKDVDSHLHVHCAADMVFHSLFKLRVLSAINVVLPLGTLSAAIPVSFQIEVLEVRGRILFGVNARCSEFTFQSEPVVDFKLTSEVGDKFKLRDIPHITEFVSKKIKMLILDRLVYPNKHSFPLLWPQAWRREDAY